MPAVKLGCRTIFKTAVKQLYEISLMFLSLKLDIRGLNPQSSITLPLGVASKILGKANNATENMKEFTQEQNIKEKKQIYDSSQSEHSLLIHQIQQSHHSN